MTRKSAPLRLRVRNRLRRTLRGLSEWRETKRADVLVVSYPKCGRTWLRLLMARALQEEYRLDVLTLELEQLTSMVPKLPRVYFTHEGEPYKQSPDELEVSKRRYARKQVILLVRDPRDIVVSLYFHVTRRQRAFTGSLAEFVTGRRGGFDTIIAFYNNWARQRALPKGLLLVRYEDLHRNAAGELRRVMDFLGVAVSDVSIEAAVRYATFENMRELEKKQHLDSYRLRPAKSDDPESFKTRRGKVGGFRDYLDAPTVADLSTRLERLDPMFGYRPDGVE